MKALCVTPERSLELRDVPAPSTPPAGHVVIDVQASAINHGDIVFLRMPNASSQALAGSQHAIWGVSGAGRVRAIGAGVPAHYLGRQVAMYRSLKHSEHTIGVWSEQAQLPLETCLLLPEHVDAVDYAGSLVNVITAYAFLEQIKQDGHRGVVVTAGNSATGLAMAALARRRQLPALFLVCDTAARDMLHAAGVEHVLVTTDDIFAERFTALAQKLGTTAVFDGVGGELPGQLAPLLPLNSTLYFYGFLAGPAPFSVPSLLFSMKNLRMQSFSNFASATVREADRLRRALDELEGVIDDPLFRTRLGQRFPFAQIERALSYKGEGGAKAVLSAA